MREWTCYRLADGLTASYRRQSQSSLPELRLTLNGKRLGSWRGSSLGPCNAQCAPDASDKDYWREMAKEFLPSPSAVSAALDEVSQ